MPLEKTQCLDERYKLLRQIGGGSEGKVYLAFQEHTFRFYAVKQIEKQNHCFSVEGLEVWKRLKHPGLPEIVDILNLENEVWIVMEYIEGISLKNWLDKRGPLSEKQMIRWGIEICRILEYLHSQNPPIVYGDLKPENIMIQKNMPVLVDLGSAVLKGSKGKRTGTRDYDSVTAYEETEIKEDVRNFGKLLLSLCDEKRNKQLYRFAKKICTDWVDQQNIAICDCRRQLEKWRNAPIRNMTMLFLTVLVLGGGLSILINDGRKENKQEQYEYFVKTAEQLNGEEQKRMLIEAIRLQPESERAYLLFLEKILEDDTFSVQEDIDYRKIINSIDEKTGNTFEELLKNNLLGYQKVCYETGLAYWYYYDGREGRTYASSWFEKVCSIPKEVCTDHKLWEKSQLYKRIGKDRLLMEKYEVTGEEGKVFSNYWIDLNKLADSDVAKEEAIRYMFWEESILIVRQYLVEFYHAGITQKQMDTYLRKMEGELDKLPNYRRDINEQKEEIQKIKELLEEEIKQIYNQNQKEEDHEID